MATCGRSRGCETIGFACPQPGIHTSRWSQSPLAAGGLLWLNLRIRPVGADRREEAMGFIAFLVLGLIAGAIAKQLLPGEQGAACS